MGLATALPALPRTANAELDCRNNPYTGLRTCHAGIDQDRLNTVYSAQQQSQWCWAACLEMVFTYYGHPVAQQRIVSQTWGAIVDMPAQPQQIIADLNRRWRDEDGQAFRVRGDAFTANLATAAQDLAADKPLILGSLGHAMVLTAVSYQGVPGPYSAVQPVGAIVRDPWPGRGRRPLTTQEYLATILLVRIRVS